MDEYTLNGPAEHRQNSTVDVVFIVHSITPEWHAT